MELEIKQQCDKVLQGLLSSYNQVEMAHQLLEDGRIINAYRQIQGVKMKLSALIDKTKELQNVLAK